MLSDRTPEDNVSYSSESDLLGSSESDVSDFKYEFFNNEVTITGYVGHETILNIPSEIEGKKVTGIGNSAFFCYTELTEISISDEVTSIGEYAFKNCSSLTEITIPDSVTSIGNSAFDGCNITVYAPHKASYYGWTSYDGVKNGLLTDFINKAPNEQRLVPFIGGFAYMIKVKSLFHKGTRGFAFQPSLQRRFH